MDPGVHVTPTAYAIATYTPPPARKGIALCLSGGGFRASIYHLGALRRLNELGVLSQVDTISAVSGGSILAAHVAQRLRSWPDRGESFPDWEKAVAEPFRQFVSQNLRTLPILERLLPWNWFRPSTAVEALARAYRARLADMTLIDLPEHPNFIFCATDMTFGVDWIFGRNKVGDYQLGYTVPPADFPLARAVAASSCFPPVFNPIPLGISSAGFSGGDYFSSNGDTQPHLSGKSKEQIFYELRLTDGGVYDNLGLERVWKDHQTILISDGGGSLQATASRTFFKELNRYVDILGDQGVALRKRWLIANFIKGELHGAYWGIGSSAEHYRAQAPGYSEEIVDELIDQVRTDLDAFSRGEIAVLENHGYFLADAAAQQHVPELITLPDTPLSPPFPEWMDETRVREALAGSSKRKFFGRF